MDFALTEQQELIRKEVAALARTFSLDYWLEKDRKHEYPDEFVKAFADNGWLGLMIPEEFGGAGLGVTEAAIMLHEICASGAGTSGASPIHFYCFPPEPVVRYGTEELKRRELPEDRHGRDRDVIRRHRAELGHRHLAHRHAGREEGRPLDRQRAQGLDDERPARQSHPAPHAHQRPRPRQAAQGHDALLHRVRPQGHHGARDREARPGGRGLQRDLHRQPGSARGERRRDRRGRLLPPDRLAQSRAHRGRHRGGGHRARRPRARRPVRQGADRLRPAHRQEPGDRPSAGAGDWPSSTPRS